MVFACADQTFVSNLISAGKLRQVKLDADMMRIPMSSLARFMASLQK
jgi:hypothetical protein